MLYKCIILFFFNIILHFCYFAYLSDICSSFPDDVFVEIFEDVDLCLETTLNLKYFLVIMQYFFLTNSIWRIIKNSFNFSHHFLLQSL